MLPRPVYVRALVPVAGGRVRLCSWGRAGPGEWWACVAAVDRVTGRPDDDPELVLVTAWIPAAVVRPIGSEDYSGVPRVELPADPAEWPAPEIDPYEWRWERHDYGRRPEGIARGARRRELPGASH